MLRPTMPKRHRHLTHHQTLGDRAMRGIGQRLRAIRERTSMSQSEISDLLNITCSTWSRWESGERMPDPAIMIQFAARAKVSLDLIYRGLATGTHPALRELLEIEVPHLLATSPTDTDRHRDMALAAYRTAIDQDPPAPNPNLSAAS